MRLASAPPGVARYFYVSRRQADGDFTEGDRDLFELLRLFLVGLRERFDAHTYETNGSGLTDREAEILAWVARGRRTRRSRLSSWCRTTVRKHLEHAFKKLRVHTRRPLSPAPRIHELMQPRRGCSGQSHSNRPFRGRRFQSRLALIEP